MVTAQSLIDFIACLGLLTLLVASYGALRLRLPGTSLAPQLLGLLFGSVAALQMWLPITPFEGIVIDMRVVPIVLAGAFLGLRGASIAVVIALAVRISIGGAGWFAGAMSILTAAAAGVGWAILTIGPAHRPKTDFLWLGAAACLTLWAAVLLPRDAAWWFLTHGALAFVAAYMVLVPALALLLERQRIAMQHEEWERAARAAQSGLEIDTPAAMTLAFARAEAMGRFRDGAGVLALRVRSSGLSLSFWGMQVEVAVLQAVDTRFRSTLPPGAELRMVSHGEFIVLLERIHDPKTVLAELAATVTEALFEVPGMAPVRLVLTGRIALFDRIPTWSQTVAAFDGSAPQPPGTGHRPGHRPGVRGTVATLFDTADRLFEACRAEREIGHQGRSP